MKKEDFLKKIKEIDTLTKVDSLVLPGDSLQINVRKNGTRKYEVIHVPSKHTQLLTKGKKFKSLVEELGNIETEQCVNNTQILCFVSASNALTFDGKVKTNWLSLDPFMPFEMQKGLPVFEQVSFLLSRREYEIAKETGLAFYDDATDCIYAIKDVARSYIGKLLDAKVAFERNDSDVPLGSAIMLAYGCSKRLDLNLITIKISESFYAVIGAGTKVPPVLDTFSFIFEKLNEDGVYDVIDYTIEDDKLSMTAKKLSYENSDYELCIKVCLRLTAGNTSVITSCAKFGNAYVSLKTNTLCFNDREKMFEGIFESLNKFKDDYTEQCDKPIITKVSMAGIKAAIGKKRADGINVTGNTKGEYYKSLLANCYNADLGFKQADDLQREFGLAFEKIFRKEAI